MKAGLAAFLDRFHQSEVAHVDQVVFSKGALAARHALLGNVHRQAGEMRGSSLAVGGSCIVVETSQPFLLLDRAHRGVHLDGLVKLLVVRLSEILQEVARPRPAETPRRLDARINADGMIFREPDKLVVSDQLFQCLIVLDTG